MARKGQVTAAELIEQLARDPEYQARLAERKREWARRDKEIAAAAAPLKSALREKGIDPVGFGSFVNDPKALLAAGVELPPRFPEEAAMPVLIEWLPRVDHLVVKESLVRHLRNRAARPAAARPLLDELRVTPPERDGLRWVIAESLAYVAPPEMFEELLEVAVDPSFGSGRQPIVDGVLWRMKTERATQALYELSKDEDVTFVALSALRRKLGSNQVKPHAERLTRHPNARVRENADEQLRRIEKALAKRAAKGG